MKTAVHIRLLKWFCIFVCFSDYVIACPFHIQGLVFCYAKWVCGNKTSRIIKFLGEIYQ